MTEELLARLTASKHLIQGKSVFNPTEAKIIFDLFNDITGERRQVTSCGACVNTVLTRLKKEMRNAGI
jgi:hypothetical protein